MAELVHPAGLAQSAGNIKSQTDQKKRHVGATLQFLAYCSGCVGRSAFSHEQSHIIARLWTKRSVGWPQIGIRLQVCMQLPSEESTCHYVVRVFPRLRTSGEIFTLWRSREEFPSYQLPCFQSIRRWLGWAGDSVRQGGVAG